MKNLTLTQALKQLQNKEISAVELTKACLEQIEKHNKDLNVFLTVAEKEALEQAKNADETLKSGEKGLPLLGVPIALKDMYSTKGIRTTAGSKVLDNYIPQFDATATRKLKEAGAIIIGKTNQDAWAHGASGENSDFGPTKNPWNPELVPGGSSSGSAVAVASNMALATGGTDTGGSIRQPASFTNTVGLKPTYGRVSRYGIVAMASSFDTIGHFTKTVEDSATYLQVTAGHDSHDATIPEVDIPDYLKNLKKGVKGVKIGIPKEYFEGVDEKIKNSVNKMLVYLEEQGAKLIEVSLPSTKYAIACYYVLVPSEISSNLARYDGIRYGNDRTNFGDEAKRRILIGTFALSSGYYDAYYKKAMQVRTIIGQEFNKTWQHVDVIAAPVSPVLPWKIGEKVNDPLAMYAADALTTPINLAGIPGLSVPCDFVNGLPVGIQFVGPHFSEDLLFKVGYVAEQKDELWKKELEL